MEHQPDVAIDAPVEQPACRSSAGPPPQRRARLASSSVEVDRAVSRRAISHAPQPPLLHEDGIGGFDALIDTARRIVCRGFRRSAQTPLRHNHPGKPVGEPRQRAAFDIVQEIYHPADKAGHRSRRLRRCRPARRTRRPPRRSSQRGWIDPHLGAVANVVLLHLSDQVMRRVNQNSIGRHRGGAAGESGM